MCLNERVRQFERHMAERARSEDAETRSAKVIQLSARFPLQ